METYGEPCSDRAFLNDSWGGDWPHSVGPDSEGGYTCYDADKARKALPAGQCVAHFFTFNRNHGCPMGCDDPTHDDHKGVDPVAHRWQADMPKVLYPISI